MRSTAVLAALAAGVTLGSAHAVGVGELGLSVDQIRSLNAQLTAPRAAPGIAFGSPVAYGADWGQLFAGIGGETVPPGAPDSVDGSMLLGLGVGDSATLVGLELSASLISLTEGFGDDGAFNAKLHRALPGRASIAVGIEGTAGWGNARSADESTYAVYTQAFDLAPASARQPVPLVFNVGLGTERFVDPGDGGVGLFGSVSLHPHRQLGLILDYTGRDANAAVSVVPFYRYPVVLTVGAVNLGNRHGLDTEFAGGLGMLYQF
jgi:hypothetical protein